jgi:hypothetical protein
MPTTGKQWLSNFSKAKSEYSKMKVLEGNTLFKLLSRKGATEDNLQKTLSRYSSDKDVDMEVFNEVVSRLSPATQIKVEGAAIKNLVNKNTMGASSEYQAIHFPQLREDMAQLNIQTAHAKNIFKVVDEFAKVYKNDPRLASISGKTIAAAPSQALTTDLKKKADFAIISNIWNGMAKYGFTRNANNLALVHQVDKLFKNPMHAKTVDQLLKDIPKEDVPAMKSLIKELQIQTAKEGPKAAPTTINMYKQSKSGKLVVTDGALGKGIYLVDSIKNPVNKGNIVKQEVDLSKLATLESIASLVGKPVDVKSVRTIPGLQQKLIDKGFTGIRLDGKAMLFPDKPSRTVYRSAPTKETASELTPRSRAEFVYAGTKDTAEIYSVGNKNVTSSFKVPKGAKLLELAEPAVQDKIFKEFFKGKVPEGLTKEELWFDLHEGALGVATNKRLAKYLKDNGYVGHSFGAEEAYLPGVLKDKGGK